MVRWAVLACTFLSSLLLLAPFSNGQKTPPGASPDGAVTHPLQVAVRGCVKPGVKDGEYVITDSNGTTWRLMSGNVNLSDHVGQSVLVTGKPEPDGKQASTNEPSGKPQIGLRVLSVKTIGGKCGP